MSTQASVHNGGFRQTLGDGQFVVTVEESAKIGGFGSAFLEAAVAERLDTRLVHIVGLPDEFINHGDRSDLLAEHGLSPEAIARTCRAAVPVQA